MNALVMTGLLALLTPGLYHTGNGLPIYVGIEHEVPDAPIVQSYDPATRRLVESPKTDGWRLQTALHEQRATIATSQGKIGVSLYYTDDRKRSTIVLIHGNDAETREMGFLISYLAVHGINVIAYDQRGTGASDGNWQRSGPQQRAADVDAVVDAFASNARVDRKRIGVWGFSNGGWTAPIVATRRPIAFMILKSAPAESLEENILFEAKQRMLRAHQNSTSTASAIETWRSLLGALCDNGSWAAAAESYRAAKRSPWFGSSLLPPNLHLPLHGADLAGWRNFACYDPGQTLSRVTTPTLALYGTEDRAVDAPHSMRTLRTDFKEAGMTDLTIRSYPGAGHTLELSPDGFVPSVPVRFAPGYPEIMIDWLARRGFLN